MNQERYDFERELVGIAITFPETLPRIVSSLVPSNFEDDATRRMFTIIQELSASDQPVTQTTLQTELSSRKSMNATWLELVGGRVFIGEVGMMAQAVNCEYLIHMIRRYSRRSTLQAAALKLINARDDMNIQEDELVAEFEQTVALTSAPVSTVRTIGEAAQLAIDLQRETLRSGRSQGFMTGFENLDYATGGLRRGNLVLLSGRSYTGKTTLALNLAVSLAKQKYKTVFRCLEMKDFELAERVLCAESNAIRLSQFARSDFDEAELDEAQDVVARLNELPLWLPDVTEDTVATISAKAKYHKSRYGLDVLFVDHLQRLKRLPQHKNDQSPRFHLNESVNAMKNLARSLDCVVVLLTQLKIPDEGKELKDPTEADYSESKQIMTEADIGMLLHRQKDEAGGRLILNKVRRGASDEVHLLFDGPHQRFTEKNPTPQRYAEFDEYAGDISDYGTYTKA